MRRVRTVYVVRSLAPVVSGFGVFALALWGIGREVWVAKVFENMPAVQDISAVIDFSVRAFVGTEPQVQVLVLAVIVTAACTLYGSIRSVKGVF